MTNKNMKSYFLLSTLLPALAFCSSISQNVFDPQLSVESVKESIVGEEAVLSHFLSNVTFSSASLPKAWDSLDGLVHYRNIPGVFPADIHYHFDGLAHVMKVEFTSNGVSVTVKPFMSAAFEKHNNCLFWGTGSFSMTGFQLCSINPGVNLLPIDNELWLTIDTNQWGRMSLDLETLPGHVDVPSFTLNAHPACDSTGCYVSHSCSKLLPMSNQVCISRLIKSDTGLAVETLSSAATPWKLIQHSHSPCLTENFIVVKIDAFKVRSSPVVANSSGVLRFLQQEENDVWAVMDRRTNQTRLLKSDISFVNNHFWNCYEERKSSSSSETEIVVDTVMATEEYLDQYFESTLRQKETNWDRLFHGSWRCRIGTSSNAEVKCDPLTDIPFDYPTFNPYVKTMNTSVYRNFYAIAPQTNQSRWFDAVIKVSTDNGRIVQSFHKPGHYFTEPTFVPLDADVSETDDRGALVTVAYDEESNTSRLIVLDASDLSERYNERLPSIIPFHAHGISHFKGQWFTNP